MMLNLQHHRFIILSAEIQDDTQHIDLQIAHVKHQSRLYIILEKL